MSEFELRIRLDDEDDLQAAREVAQEQSGLEFKEIPKPPGGLQPEVVEPVSAILVAAAAVAAAKFVLDWWERRKGGLVIDLRNRAENAISRNREVPYGYVIIFAPDGGKVTVEVKDAPKDAWERLLGQVISGTFDTVSSLADGAARVVGDDKVQRDTSDASAKTRR